MQRGGYRQPEKPENSTPPSRRGTTAADVAKAIDTMANTLAGYAVELASMRNARYADPLDRERDKVARLRSRILGLYRALQEAQDQATTWRGAARENGQDAVALEQSAGTMIGQLRSELGNALRIGAQYREAAEQLQASLDKLHGHKFSERVHGVIVARAAQAEERAKRLEEIADQALTGWSDSVQAAAECGVGNYSDQPMQIRDLRVKLHGELAPPAEREDEPDPIEEERPQVCKFGAPGCPGWPHNASDAAKICPAHEELYERARRAGMPASGRHG
jgi:hypothetical protein